MIYIVKSTNTKYLLKQRHQAFCKTSLHYEDMKKNLMFDSWTRVVKIIVCSIHKNTKNSNAKSIEEDSNEVI